MVRDQGVSEESSLVEFLRSLNSELGVVPPHSDARLSETEAGRVLLARMNRYFFQTRQGIGNTIFNEGEVQYFSEFHKYWERHHAELLELSVDEGKVAVTAECLSTAVRRFGVDILRVTHDTHGLSKEAVAQVRFLTANQDFRSPPDEAYLKYLNKPEMFDPAEIASNPDDFLKELGASRLSQTDKRLDFARNAANFLLKERISAYGISARFDNDATRIRDGLVAVPNMGYGQKKANMFVRDMSEMGVWPNLSHFEGIEVASDINTMKVALRTGILKSKIPLVSSFLDIFGYQYASVDQKSAEAWRSVWQTWREKDSATAPTSPSQLDFVIYRIGREYCKDFVTEYRCGKGHEFLHFGGQLRRCRICATSGTRTEVRAVRWVLPCQVKVEELPHENGKLLLDSDNLLSAFQGVCIFEPSCRPKESTFRALDPPKSISVIGQTGWTNSYADEVTGGGGMMG